MVKKFVSHLAAGRVVAAVIPTTRVEQSGSWLFPMMTAMRLSLNVTISSPGYAQADRQMVGTLSEERIANRKSSAHDECQ